MTTPLHPCPSCRRHVYETRCPFCGASVEHPAPRAALAGRLSRAAVFASATLVSCTPAPTPQHAPSVSPAPPSSVLDAAPPPDTADVPATGKAIVRGTVKQGTRTVAGALVTMSGPETHQTTSDDHGHYDVRDVSPGKYVLTVRARGPGPRAGLESPEPTIVNLAAGDVYTIDLPVAPDPASVEERGACCKPYGAPPARRRLV